MMETWGQTGRSRIILPETVAEKYVTVQEFLCAAAPALPSVPAYRSNPTKKLRPARFPPARLRRTRGFGTNRKFP